MPNRRTLEPPDVDVQAVQEAAAMQMQEPGGAWPSDDAKRVRYTQICKETLMQIPLARNMHTMGMQKTAVTAENRDDKETRKNPAGVVREAEEARAEEVEKSSREQKHGGPPPQVMRSAICDTSMIQMNR